MNILGSRALSDFRFFFAVTVYDLFDSIIVR